MNTALESLPNTTAIGAAECNLWRKLYATRPFRSGAVAKLITAHKRFRWGQPGRYGTSTCHGDFYSGIRSW